MRVTTIALLLCGTAMPALAQDVSAVSQFTSAMRGGDAASAAAMFTDDATVLPPGRAEISGKPQIQMFLGGMAHGVQNLQYTSEGIKPVGDSGAREVGSFSFKMKGRNGGQAQDVAGKYLIVWERSGGDWKIAADMWNRNGGGRSEKPGKTAGRGGQPSGTSDQTGNE